jgi:N-terminal acetyltransferase B complex non-catalytic subunit
MNQLLTKTTFYKFRYLVLPEVTEPQAAIPISIFATEALKLYRESFAIEIAILPTDDHPGDDACILAVMALVKLHHYQLNNATYKGHSHLISAAALLEYLISKSNHNYQALLYLIRLYQILGLPSLAFEAYSRLKVKTIQHETMAHHIFTRISLMHPFETRIDNDDLDDEFDEKYMTPWSTLSAILRYYDKYPEKGYSSAKKALETGRYSHARDILTTSEKSEDDFTRWMLIVESHKIKKFTGHEIYDSSSTSSISCRGIL